MAADRVGGTTRREATTQYVQTQIDAGKLPRLADTGLSDLLYNDDPQVSSELGPDRVLAGAAESLGQQAPGHVRTPRLIALGAASRRGTEMQLDCNAPGSRLIHGAEDSVREPSRTVRNRLLRPVGARRARWDLLPTPVSGSRPAATLSRHPRLIASMNNANPKRNKDGVARMFRSIKAMSIAVASAAVLVVTFPGAAMASGTGCGGDEYNVAECTQVIGTGLQITSIAGQVKNFNSVAVGVEILFWGPNNEGITSTGWFLVNPGGVTAWMTWHNPNPTANMTPGQYCTAAIGSNGINYSQDCIDVHS